MKTAIYLLGLVAVAFAAHLSENFDEAGVEDRWVDSTVKSDLGKFKVATGKYYSSADNKGYQTSTDAKFYQSSTRFETFSNKDKDLVIQFSVKHEQDIDCGGGYVKVWPSTLEQTEMTGDSEYNIMFGPDICGPGTRKVHTIFAYKGENLQNKKTISAKTDTDSHLYTLIVRSDNTYEVQIDGAKVESGSLYDDFDFLPPKKIKDPAQSKPEDWVDDKTIPDPEDTKPEDWDQPEHIADPEATKPDDWDDDMDGEWEPPMIDNPDYKGEWQPKQIDNPEYKGEWVHPEIDNPDYFEDDAVYLYEDFGVIGFDIWQVKSGTVFDNLLVTDDVEEAAKAAEEFKTIQAAEKKMKEDEEAAKKAAEEAAAETADDEEEEEVDEEEDAPAKDEL